MGNHFKKVGFKNNSISSRILSKPSKQLLYDILKSLFLIYKAIYKFGFEADYWEFESLLFIYRKNV